MSCAFGNLFKSCFYFFFMSGTLKEKILITLVILLIAPFVFVGTCYPLAFLGIGIGLGGGSEILGWVFFFGAWPAGIALSIFVCYNC